MKTRIFCILIIAAFAVPGIASDVNVPFCCPTTAVYPSDLDENRPMIDEETLTVSESKLIGSWKIIDYNHTLSTLVQWNFEADGTFEALNPETDEVVSIGDWNLSDDGSELMIIERNEVEQDLAFLVRDLGFHTLNLYQTAELNDGAAQSMFFEKM